MICGEGHCGAGGRGLLRCLGFLYLAWLGRSLGMSMGCLGRAAWLVASGLSEGISFHVRRG